MIFTAYVYPVVVSMHFFTFPKLPIPIVSCNWY